jgi:malic enzyme
VLHYSERANRIHDLTTVTYDTKHDNSNNLYIFPGLALGSKLVQATHITNGMLMAASEALAATNKPSDLAQGKVYPGNVYFCN